jgi:hypothetical protein
MLGMRFVVTGVVGGPGIVGQGIGICTAIVWNFTGNIHVVWYET